MKSRSPLRKNVTRLPKLAAVMLVFLGLSTNTHLDAATAWHIHTAPLPPHIVPQTKSSFAAGRGQIHVLGDRDAALYRAAFAAQEKADWKFADEALAEVKDKKLIGHVLADRYLRRGINMTEARQWMASYADLPEAATLYGMARSLHGFAKAQIARPQRGSSWSGNNGLSSTLGFRGANDNNAREAAAFFYRGKIERARPLAHTAASSGAPLGLWIEGLSAWEQQDFGAAAQSFISLAQTPGLSSWDRAAASYWAYRATSHRGDKAQSYHWLAEAARYPRSFYGFMAASLMGHHPDRSWNMPTLNEKNIATLAARPDGWQALALVQVERSDLAESELRRLMPMNAREKQTAALALAEMAHMPSLTLQLGGVVTNDNGQPFDAALYPLPPWQPEGGFKVDRALIYALMRRESQFDPAAVSDKGACGLMQIMPATARHIANENRAEHADRNCPDRLFDPAVNMGLGQKYVRMLAEKPIIGNNLLLLLAAYNGGPGNLAHWLDGENRSDPLLFIETLPMRETRDYVQRVLLHYWMYRARLSEPETAVAQLSRGEWPRYVLRDEGGVKQADAGGLELASLEAREMAGGQ